MSLSAFAPCDALQSMILSICMSHLFYVKMVVSFQFFLAFLANFCHGHSP